MSNTQLQNSKRENFLLTRKEAIALLRISPGTMDKLIRLGLISHCRMKRKIFFTPEHIEEYVERLEVKARNGN